MNARIFRGNERIGGLSPADRGLAYGDGLFETLLATDGSLPWWPAHWQRLAWGAQQLAIALPDEGLICAAAAELAQGRRCVLKIILTRGESGRGYLPAEGPATCIVSAHPMPEPWPQPLHLYRCRTPVVEVPQLAGIKHLNRLGNVLARRECALAGHVEGIMADKLGNAVCATSGNLFVRIGDTWLTPDLSACGIAGITRAWLLAHAGDVRTGTVDSAALASASTAFVCNAIRGIVPVAGIGEISYTGSDALDALCAGFLAANPFFGET